MKLVVGLGNPGRKYTGTRHNVGFEVIDRLVERHGLAKSRTAFHGETVDAKIGGERSLLLRPQTFMNRSGRSVAEALRFFKMEVDDLMVVCDCMDLPLGKLRLRPGGSPGGHNGLADIGRSLGTTDFARLRIGIDRPPAGWEGADFVLARFDASERDEMDRAVMAAADAVERWAGAGIDDAMNQFN